MELSPSDGERGLTSASLLNRVRQQDQEAWERLVKIYTPLVFHWCRRESRLSQEDAADVMQEVFRSVASSIAQFRQQRVGGFRSWLRTITVNKIRDMIRKARGRADAVGGSGWNQRLQELPESSSDSAEAAEEGLVMKRAVEVLADKYKESTRKAFWLVTFEGYTAAESAEMLGITEQAVWQACFRVRRRLREELAGLLD